MHTSASGSRSQAAPDEVARSVPVSSVTGLTTTEAVDRRRGGLGNTAPLRTTRTYWQIISENLFTFVNTILYLLGLALLVVGRPSDALITVGVALINALVSIVQEIRAKRELDRIALLTRPHAAVVRDGQVQALDPGEIVTGDVLIAQPGDQIMVDGPVLSGTIDVDESLLTGEAAPVARHAGDLLHSGTFCVTGKARYQAERVGERSEANQITANARTFRRVLTPLQQGVNFIVRMLLVVTFFYELFLFVHALAYHTPLVDLLRTSVVIIGLVPIGLFLAISVAYASGALRLIGKRMLVQQANAVESLSHVDVLCLDKTGTLTTSRLVLDEVVPLDAALDSAAVRQALGEFVASVSARNATTEAIAAACPGRARPIATEVPFSSAYKWSALTYAESPDDHSARPTWLLGAPDVLLRAMPAGNQRQATIREQVSHWESLGMRVLLFACAAAPVAARGPQGEPELPAQIEPIGLLRLRDELRQDVQTTLRHFTDAGIQLKLVSGDAPDTVRALAEQAGVVSDAPPCNGPELAEGGVAGLAEVAEPRTVFGRMRPEQKAQLVAALQRHGHYVAMIGDGINDVPAMKQANMCIGLNGGSQAARSVADLVLLGDAFTELPTAFAEGQRISNGLHNILQLFLTRLLYVLIVIQALGVAGTFPFTLKQKSLMEPFILGIPTLALVAWAPSGTQSQRQLLRSLFHFIVPAGLTIALFSIGVYLWYYLPGPHLVDWSGFRPVSTVSRELYAQSALSLFLTLCGLLVFVFVMPPNAHWVGGMPLVGDRRPLLLAGVLFVAYLGMLLLPAVRSFFEFTLLTPVDLIGLMGCALLWALAVRTVWRTRVFERYFSVDPTPPSG